MKKKDENSEKELKESIDNLTHIMKKIYDLFSEASEEMYAEHDLNSSRVMPLAAKLDVLIEQNKILAKSILKVLDELKEVKKEEKNLKMLIEKEKLQALSKELEELEKQHKENE